MVPFRSGMILDCTPVELETNIRAIQPPCFLGIIRTYQRYCKLCCTTEGSAGGFNTPLGWNDGSPPASPLRGFATSSASAADEAFPPPAVPPSSDDVLGGFDDQLEL
jgi:hypothetical protein